MCYNCGCGMPNNDMGKKEHGDWAGDVKAYDDVHIQILHMADILADGIVNQFPAKFK